MHRADEPSHASVHAAQLARDPAVVRPPARSQKSPARGQINPPLRQQPPSDLGNTTTLGDRLSELVHALWRNRKRRPIDVTPNTTPARRRRPTRRHHMCANPNNHALIGTPDARGVQVPRMCLVPWFPLRGNDAGRRSTRIPRQQRATGCGALLRVKSWTGLDVADGADGSLTTACVEAPAGKAAHPRRHRAVGDPGRRKNITSPEGASEQFCIAIRVGDPMRRRGLARSSLLKIGGLEFARRLQRSRKPPGQEPSGRTARAEYMSMPVSGWRWR